ncbi:hypothetical protein BC628DRAFT_87301 [Trametes gibbosa]|nr:hypothetical protein BC628DRAFT_87301 [Trametes gibbosa]
MYSRRARRRYSRSRSLSHRHLHIAIIPPRSNFYLRFPISLSLLSLLSSPSVRPSPFPPRARSHRPERAPYRRHIARVSLLFRSPLSALRSSLHAFLSFQFFFLSPRQDSHRLPPPPHTRGRAGRCEESLHSHGPARCSSSTRCIRCIWRPWPRTKTQTQTQNQNPTPETKKKNRDRCAGGVRTPVMGYGAARWSMCRCADVPMC